VLARSVGVEVFRHDLGLWDDGELDASGSILGVKEPCDSENRQFLENDSRVGLRRYARRGHGARGPEEERESVSLRFRDAAAAIGGISEAYDAPIEGTSTPG